MPRLIPVKYHPKINFPSHINVEVHEVHGNFHREKPLPHMHFPYSLHTECSYGEISFSAKIINYFKNIASAQKNGIPKLWENKKWADDFFKFIVWLIGPNKPPDVLEIHPPYNDYCTSLEQFLDIFNVFYNKFNASCPETTILIENRYGTKYNSRILVDGKSRKANFLLSKCDEVWKFAEILSGSPDVKLKIVLDYPQLFSAESPKDDKKGNWMGINPLKLLKKIILFNRNLKKNKKVIGGFHMWGKEYTKNRWNPHSGNFDTFFSNDKKLKRQFLNSLVSTFNDDTNRYFVPEVKRESDLYSIVTDMEKKGFIFS
jgi:hypothetical protein